jgi:hypothetical protein
MKRESERNEVTWTRVLSLLSTNQMSSLCVPL